MKKVLSLIVLTSLITTSSCRYEKFNELPVEENEPAELIESIPPPIDETRWYPIMKFVDGDTFWIDDDTPQGVKIRFIGMDTPECRPIFGRPAEPYGKTAAQYVKNRIGNRKVRLELDLDYFDRYNRTLAYVYLEDGTFLNEELLQKGLAKLMTISPNVVYAKRFIKAQKQARTSKLGLWSDVDKP